jgi:hypothetical protein
MAPACGMRRLACEQSAHNVRQEFVMPGLDPAIHVFLALVGPKTWMPGTSPGMTTSRVTLDN